MTMLPSDTGGKACPRINGKCYLKWCKDNRACKAENTFRQESENMRQFMVCPMAAANETNICYDKACREAGECQDSPIGEAKPTSWKCPKDGLTCAMVTCNGGQSCYSQTEVSAGTYSAYNNTYYRSAATPPCHSGMVSLGFINKAEIMVGKESSAKCWDVYTDGPIGLILGLLGDAFPQGDTVGMNEYAEKLAGHSLLVPTKIVPNIWIKWPDYGIVPFERAWWDKLLNVISGVDGAVLIYCMGGHGRTGTAAAILGCISGLIPEGEDPVVWLRQKYCEKVVESSIQIKYIEHITGRKVGVTAAKEYSSYASGGATYVKKKTKKASKVAEKSPEVLSKRKWKTWWRKTPRDGTYAAIAHVSRPCDLPDGQTFVIGSKTWVWDKKDDQFVLA